MRGGPVGRVLDLGAGTGLMSEHVLAAHPAASVVLLDGAGAMLAVAAQRIGDRAIELCEQDLRDELPAGPFDAAVSALAIHHLDDAAKRDLLTRVHERLRPGGAFVNLDQVAAPTAWLDRANHAAWRAQCLELGATAAELAAAAERMAFDRPARLDAQLRWMREAGFTDVDCLHKAGMLAVYAGWKSG
jgi:tRNA (cmo5U34)-methyltransferase